MARAKLSWLDARPTGIGAVGAEPDARVTWWKDIDGEPLIVPRVGGLPPPVVIEDWRGRNGGLDPDGWESGADDGNAYVTLGGDDP